ncbi:MAG: ABC transporter substrate-binding protein [Deltaproteobacteria bacterium]|nr:ABC transporter substrate-binding protein [Deltaproteobacteria bacterium]
MPLPIIRLGFVLLAFLLVFRPGELSAERIAAVLSQQTSPYQEALKGFQQFLQHLKEPLELEVYNLQGDADQGPAMLAQIKKNRPGLLFALGLQATELVTQGTRETPIVVGLMVKTDSLKKYPHVTGVSLEHSLDAQFKWLQLILPEARNIGVVYNRAENQGLVEAAAKEAVRFGLRLEAHEVPSLTDLPAALNQVVKKADVLWGLPDKVALTSQTAKHILLHSFQNDVPFIGLSWAWTKAGALYSLDYDYYDLGQQCGEMALKILNKIPVRTIPLATPRKVIYTLNLKVAEKMKINFSENIIKGAANVYR